MPTPTRPSTCCVSVQPRPDAPMVRCAACGSLESEWAARCSNCGHGLDDALEVPAAPPRRGRRRVRLGAGAVLVSAVVIIAAAVLVARRDDHAATPRAAPHRVTTSTTSTTSPADTSTLVPVSVFAVSPEGDLVEHLPGRSVTLARDAAGWPEGPVMVGSSVLYVSGGVVYEVGRPNQVFPSTAAGAPTRGQVVALL